uniref:Uncharacterized protein n=1 Tax=Aquilaria malaccensis TaxID=223753 RepID=A0A4Y6GLI1_9ROSI|nr:hypothetical protein [Aquilaria malaccensis]
MSAANDQSEKAMRLRNHLKMQLEMTERCSKGRWCHRLEVIQTMDRGVPVM